MLGLEAASSLAPRVPVRLLWVMVLTSALQVPIDILEHSAREVTNAKLEQSRKGLIYGEQKRITVPKVFKYEMGVATTDRKIEMVHAPPCPRPPHM